MIAPRWARWLLGLGSKLTRAPAHRAALRKRKLERRLRAEGYSKRVAKAEASSAIQYEDKAC